MNSELEQNINEIKTLQIEIIWRLNGWSFLRPSRSPYNQTAWEFWYRNLTLEERLAEKELRRIGHYNHEGTKTMFNCKDKNGKQIHTDDQILWRDKPCMVTCIFSETEIQINPLGEGLPELVSPSEVEVTNSFIEKLRKLSTIEELQTILKNAELRMQSEMELRKPTRTISSGPKLAKVTVKEEAIEL